MKEKESKKDCVRQGALKIKLECLHRDDDKCGVLTSANTRVYDEDTGKVLGCIQKITYTVDTEDFIPRAILEVVNLPIEVEGVDADVEAVMFGPDLKRIEDMDRDELITALKYEGKQRYLMGLELDKLKDGTCSNTKMV
jgi:hypothetical protein